MGCNGTLYLWNEHAEHYHVCIVRTPEKECPYTVYEYKQMSEYDRYYLCDSVLVYEEKEIKPKGKV